MENNFIGREEISVKYLPARTSASGKTSQQ